MLTFVLVLFTIISSSFAQNFPVPQGYYSQGSQLFAWQLDLEGEGFMRLFLHRNRGWGSQPLIDMLVQSALEMNQQFPMRDRLQVGDISAFKGGTISGHNSHQNGLDVDLTYYRINGMEQLPDIFDGFNEEMIINGKIAPNFDHARNWELLKTLHRNARVQRIFVDEIIKNELCDYAKSISEFDYQQEALRSLRPYEDHSDHWHVRLYCPENAPDCKSQEETPEGSGCL